MNSVKLNQVTEGKNESAEELLNSLSDNQRLKMAANLLGFNQIPVDIDTFIEDDYFMGKIWRTTMYPYWRERLREVYKNPIFSDYKIVVPEGAIGTGKSTFSQAMALYDLYKLSCLESLESAFKLEKTTPITIRCFNMTKGKANEVLVDPMFTRIWNSPYFIDYIKRNGGLPFNCIIGAAKQATDVISECLIFSLVSEANFMKPWVAEDIINTSISRMSSRLQMVEGVFGHIILDSSSTLKDSVVQQFLLKNSSWDNIKVIHTTIWDAKAHQGIYFNHGSFKVYCGDGNVKAHIIEDGEDTDDYDQDRIIDVPCELKPQFENDLIKSLNDQAGVSLDSNEDFISNKKAIDDACCIHQEFEDELIFDFFDNENIYDVIGDEILDALPEDRRIYGRLDLGLTEDRAGISFGYLDKVKYKEINETKVLVPDICIPVSFSLSRKRGQETNIEKIKDLFIWLGTQRDIARISTDQFQSRDLLQRLKLAGFETQLLSVDRTDEAYILLKNYILLKRIRLADSPILKYELKNLIRTSATMIDHKQSGCFIGNTELLVKSKLTNKISIIRFIDLLNNYKNYYIRSYNTSKDLFYWSDINNVWRTKFTNKLIKLEFDKYTYYCTEDHKILTTKGYVKAKDLTEDDEIIG